jgi:hypothetical protein
VKIIWSGAEVFGRDRLVSWDGSLCVNGNDIIEAVPINFWNANEPLKILGKNQLGWKSNTTGGVAGLILNLKEPSEGTIEIITLEGSIECEFSSFGLAPKVWEYGGLRKKIEIYRLPDQPRPEVLSCTLPLVNMRQGDNPIYICMVQEDGHMAWSSPIYVVKNEDKKSAY